jgi:DHA1 family inner membrane transport protein
MRMGGQYKDHFTGRGRASLSVLAIAYFALGTGSLAVVGLLEPMAKTWDVDTADVARLVTVFALTFAFAAPCFQVVFSNWPRRALLLFGLAVSGAGAIGAAFAPTLGWAIVTRIVMALGGAAVGPMASALAAHLVPPHQQVRALSFVFGGLIFSTVLGVPLATWAGHVLGWQGVFVTLGSLSLLCIPATLRFIHDRSAGAPVRVAELLGTLADPPTAWSVMTTLLQMAGQFVSYTLIALLLTERYGLATGHISLALLMFGIGGVSGNWLGGRLGDRGSALRIVWIAVGGLVVVFVAMSLVPRSPAAGLALLVAWAVLAMLFQAPQQKRLLGFAPGMGGLVLALNSSATYVGVSIGSYVSTQAWRTWGTASLPVVSAAFLAAAAGTLFFSRPSRERLSDVAG